MPKTCPQCFKTAPTDRASCINKPMGMCPDPVDTKEVNAVEIVCAAPCGGGCGKHLAVPIGNIMKRRKLTELGICAFDNCRARIVVPKAPAAKPTPPPITEVGPRTKGRIAGGGPNGQQLPKAEEGASGAGK